MNEDTLENTRVFLEEEIETELTNPKTIKAAQAVLDQVSSMAVLDHNVYDAVETLDAVAPRLAGKVAKLLDPPTQQHPEED